MVRRILDVLIILVCVTVVGVGIAHSAEIWRDGNFALSRAGWYTSEVLDRNGCVGVKMGLTLPEDGILLIDKIAALELYIPSQGWVADRGIIVFNGCRPEPHNIQDTDFMSATLTYSLVCRKEGNRVLMIVRIPRVKTSDENLPTQARWVQRKEQHYEIAR